MTRQREHENRAQSKILCPVTCYQAVGHTLRYVAAMAEKASIEVHILSFLKGDTDYQNSQGQQIDDFNTITKIEKKEVERRIHRLCEAYFKDSVPRQYHFEIGNPVEVVLKIIEGEKIDIVVLARCHESEKIWQSFTDELFKRSPVMAILVPCNPASDSPLH